MPRVTIGVPVYNAARYLPVALDALRAQDYPDFEIVISDNASTDETWEICQRYAVADARIRLWRNEQNLGGHANFGKVVELASGELFKWAAYDDICQPRFISACVEALDAAGPRAVLAYPKTVLIDEDGAVVGPYADKLDLRDQRAWKRLSGLANNISLCHAHFGVFRIEALRRTGLIRPFLSSDYTLMAEVAAIGEIHEVPERLFLRRVHGASTRQSGGSAAAATTWFAPDGSRTAARSPRATMLRQTVRALGGHPAGFANSSAFLGTWFARRARVRLGAWRRRLTGKPMPALTESGA
ncbi:glycosyltransferase family A protein [Asanoa sp. WMMD1127]|uniref:glycosyltransferase family 2 protein n=1 Tax=Asanoa sp. WMMD1127 TaxID=3016107 RepID=UPI0024160712|nr:glycosyltransferase family A protein [Asanoa sp. WMMD1127]MDG4823370.1 glycosyltransferase family A protein [Asanoa sp. WMMD1127]